ncbi:SAM-dependent methyltransferase [Denitratisoma sp. DHT3]|uniref:RsmB/NOP family class I SAM-dependent RNA methyltransferase n=1 Tax=Denitratisoma sp. DHT3 TaxID=1981880 RepID=UPI00119866B7|nr:RsmB/NOP family class I SAM-dependent RNA methyltransferase [Denitratisoma sp. DHT3]QDX82738.1 SAM-dependent methyltransferase [Denitratisoma sp. DHT3]
MKITSRLLDHAGDALTAMLRFEQPADAVLSRIFRDHRDLGHRERGFVADLTYGVLRRRRWLEKLCGERVTPRRLLLAALVRLMGFSQRQLAEALTARELEWVAELKAQAKSGVAPELSLAEAADFPGWLTDKLLAAGRSAEEVLQLANSLNQAAPLDLRVNPLKTTREAVLERFKADGIEAGACPYAPLGLRLVHKPALAKHPLFLDGSIEVQDEGSQLLGHLVAPRRGEMVVDFCAGAGGKTLLLGALMRSTGRLYAFDVSEKRLSKLKPRVARSGLSNVHTAAIASEQDQRIKRLAGKIDRVLVDAPCSGLGTLRRNPDLKWRQTPDSVAELTAKQAAILAAAARLVKVGGRLVYATCSLLEEENEAVVAGFLAAHPEFARRSCGEILAAQGIALEMGESLRLLPDRHGTDGFYAAVLERQS